LNILFTIFKELYTIFWAFEATTISNKFSKSSMHIKLLLPSMDSLLERFSDYLMLKKITNRGIIICFTPPLARDGESFKKK
jgi:hypothetical protein